ncbi:hypothetical protein ACOSP7_014332 [Xanthoceras sorbifolium]
MLGFKWAASWSVDSFFLEDLKASGGGKKATVLGYCGIFAILWVIWLERNRRIFEEAKEEDRFLSDKAYYLASIRASISEEFRDYSLFCIMLDWKDIVLY